MLRDPSCKERMAFNPDSTLMEDNLVGYHCWYTGSEREKEGIEKID